MRAALLLAFVTGPLAVPALVLTGPRRPEMYLRLCGRSSRRRHHAQAPGVLPAFVPFRWTPSRSRAVRLGGSWVSLPGCDRENEQNAVGSLARCSS